MVTKGEPLARVYNPNTEFNFMSQETGIMQQISQMRNTLLELKKSGIYTGQRNSSGTKNDYNTAQQNYNLQKDYTMLK